MGRISAAAALMLAAATAAHAQSGPVNSRPPAMAAPPPPMMATATMVPAGDLQTQLSALRDRLRSDRDQGKISRSKAAGLQHELTALDRRASALHTKVGKIAKKLP